jgi:hypothetical protein
MMQIGLQDVFLAKCAPNICPLSFFYHHILTSEILYFLNALPLLIAVAYLIATNLKLASYAVHKNEGICTANYLYISTSVSRDLLVFI